MFYLILVLLVCIENAERKKCRKKKCRKKKTPNEKKSRINEKYCLIKNIKYVFYFVEKKERNVH